MDNEVIAAIVAVLLAAAGWLKSHSEVQEVVRDRESTKHERDTKIALLEQKCEFLEDRLGDGDSRFDRMDAELKEMNKNLGNITGQLKTLISMKERSHTPESRPL